MLRSCEARAGLLSASKDGDSKFHHCVGLVKLVQDCFGQAKSRKQVSRLWRCCKACADLSKDQERSRKQFSSLCMC